MGLYDAYDRGAQNVVLTDASGNLAEGPGFNIFVVGKGRIATPDRGMLCGVTRQTTIELAAELGFALDERPVSVEEALAADEVFISSTAGCVMPVTAHERHAGEGWPHGRDHARVCSTPIGRSIRRRSGPWRSTMCSPCRETPAADGEITAAIPQR